MSKYNASSYEKLVEKMKEHFLIEDEDPIKVVIATYIANHFKSDPLWLFIIAPPSSLKTELINPLSSMEDVFPLSDLTQNTLLSGFEKGGASLIYELDKKIITMKDFTTVLEMRRERRAEVVSQLREIYDGNMVKAFGNGGRVDWKGKVGFIAGVTPVLDRYYAVFQTLGERFVQIRLRPVNARAVATMAVKSNGQEGRCRKEVAELMQECCASYAKPDLEMPKIPEDIVNKLAALAEFCVKARTHVHRERYSRDIDCAPEPEAPPRLAKQFTLLSRGLAVLRGASQVNDDDFKIVYRVAMDCLPLLRANIRSLLREEKIDNQYLVQNFKASNSTANRVLEEMGCLGLLDEQQDRLRTQWTCSEELRSCLRVILPGSMSETKPNPQCTPSSILEPFAKGDLHDIF